MLMNKDSVVREALACMPKYDAVIANGLYRQDITQYLQGNSNVGIELGVATGTSARKLIDCKRFRIVFEVDVYGDIHNTHEYRNALATIGLFSNYKLIRVTFADALDIFPDDFFDFIYIDGFAHTGEEGGRTLRDWYGKLKLNGIMSGDDYHLDWPLVMWAVNHFANQLGCKLNVTEHVQSARYSRYPTWFIRKERPMSPADLTLDGRLVQLADQERRRVHHIRMSRMLALKRQIVRRTKGLLSLK